MINNVKFVLLAGIAAASITPPTAASAQSAYTTGSAADRAAAGYPSPYGYGSGLYGYAPGGRHGHFSRRYPGHNVDRGGLAHLQLAYGGHDFDKSTDPFTPGERGPFGCGKSRGRDRQLNQCRGPADRSIDLSFARHAAIAQSLFSLS
jgi:hypothetical protein